MDIGYRVRELREERGLTVRVLSDRTDLAENSISRIERGERVPSSITVEKLARGLGVEPGELFDQESKNGQASSVKLLDELLVLFDLYTLDYNVVEDSLKTIANFKAANPDHPITASLYHFMREQGYL